MFMHKNCEIKLIIETILSLLKSQATKEREQDKPQKKAAKVMPPQKEKALHFPLHLLGDRVRSQFLHLSKWLLILLL